MERYVIGNIAQLAVPLTAEVDSLSFASNEEWTIVLLN